MINALSRDFKRPIDFSRIKNMPGTRMGAQIGKLHPQNIVFLE
jgi:hypothetical protein